MGSSRLPKSVQISNPHRDGVYAALVDPRLPPVLKSLLDGFPAADHEETAPHAPTLIISRLACSLVGTTQAVRITPGSLAYKAYGQQEVTEQFSCNYGFNPHFRHKIAKGKLRITGVGPDEEIRIVELSDYRFYVGTLFLPQNSSRADKPHPLFVEFLRAALDFRSSQNRNGAGGAIPSKSIG